MKTVYCLRTRLDDSQPWGEPEYFRTRKLRDSAASVCRIMGGIRTHSFEEKVNAEALEAIEFA